LEDDNWAAEKYKFVMIQITAHASHAPEALVSPTLTALFGDEASFTSLRLSVMRLLSPLGALLVCKVVVSLGTPFFSGPLSHS
jgi:hypothetical protein